jgi:hypothetical protein
MYWVVSDSETLPSPVDVRAATYNWPGCTSAGATDCNGGSCSGDLSNDVHADGVATTVVISGCVGLAAGTKYYVHSAHDMDGLGSSLLLSDAPASFTTPCK